MFREFPMDGFMQEMKTILASAIGIYYTYCLVCIDEFVNDVRSNVEEISWGRDEGCYNDDDIRLAIGRALLDHLDINYDKSQGQARRILNRKVRKSSRARRRILPDAP